MRRTIVRTSCCVCTLLALGVSSAASRQQSAVSESAASHAGGGCSNAMLRGTYGYFRTGATPQGPLGAVGIADYDGVGVFTTTQTISRNGVYTQASFTGAYEVNADCSGRLLSVDGQSVTSYLAIVDKGAEIFLLSASAGNAVTGIAKRAGGALVR